MKFRILGRTNLKVSEIGLGLEHFHEQPLSSIKPAIDYALEQKINYFDPIYSVTKDLENIQQSFGKRIKDVIFTAHIRSQDTNGQFSKTKNKAEALDVFNKYSEKLKRHSFEIAMLTFVEPNEYGKVMSDQGEYSIAKNLQKEKRIDFIGMSTHDIDVAKKAIINDLIDVLMFPFNFAEWNRKGTMEMIKLCNKNQIGLVTMKPFSGGKLLQPHRLEYMQKYHQDFAPSSITVPTRIQPEMCLKFVLSNPDIHVTLAGAKNYDEIYENMQYTSHKVDIQKYEFIKSIFSKYIPGECVYCNHCLPCLAQLNIGELNKLLDEKDNLEFLDQSLEDKDKKWNSIKQRYNELEHYASECTFCWQCMNRCPYDVDIIQRMIRIKEIFGK